MNQALSSIETQPHSSTGDKCVLIISDSSETITGVDKVLTQQGIQLLVTSDGEQALNLFTSRRIDYVLVDLESLNIPCDELVYSFRVRISGLPVPIIVISSSSEEEDLSRCFDAGCDDFLLKPLSEVTLLARLSSIDKVQELKALYNEAINDQLIAKQVLDYAMSERNNLFEEIKYICRSKSVFSGDLFLTTKHPDGGVHVLVADFTGHGLSAAISALPVADIFSAMTLKGFEVTEILENINNKLHTLLPSHMFMACIMVKISHDMKTVNIWNGGMPDIYVRDSITGETTQKHRSLHIALGIVESEKDQFIPETIKTEPSDQLIIFSDGLTEAENNKGEMYGEEGVEKCLSLYRSYEDIFPLMVNDFNKFCGSHNPDDDVTLACVPCSSQLTDINYDEAQEKGK